MAECVFCEIVHGRSRAKFIYNGEYSIAIVPLNPVTEGHVLVIPRMHVRDFTHSWVVTGNVMQDASRLAVTMGPAVNLITSKGAEATQTVFHLHVHLVPRREGDGLHLPWTGQNDG